MTDDNARSLCDKAIEMLSGVGVNVADSDLFAHKYHTDAMFHVVVDTLGITALTLEAALAGATLEAPGPLIDLIAKTATDSLAPTTLQVGEVYLSVCTPVDDELTAVWANAEHPTVITSRWAVSDDPTFADGTPNPCPCPDRPETHRHVLFVR